MRIGPTSRDEGAVPATDRFRLHEQTAPPVTRKDPGQRGQEHSIGWMATRSGDLPAKHGELVTQNEYLDLVRGV